MDLKHFTVGPTKLHPGFEDFLRKGMEEHIGSISHRSSRFEKLFADLSDNLKKLLDIPKEYAVFYSGSATEFMERILQNCSGERTLHFVNGAFSEKFSDIGASLGREVTKAGPLSDHSFSVESIPECSPEVVCLTHNETSNGVQLPEKFVEEVGHRFKDQVIAMDIVSSAPTSEVNFSGIDCMFFSVQKGFGLPAGLGAMFVSPKALERARRVEEGGSHYTGSFHSFGSFYKLAQKNQTPATPNVLEMYLLNEVVLDFLNKGLAEIKKETKRKAAAIYEALERSEGLEPSIGNRDMRSDTVIVADTREDSRITIEKIKGKGFLIAGGYGDKKAAQIRIGNFPSHTGEEVAALADLLAST